MKKLLSFLTVITLVLSLSVSVSVLGGTPVTTLKVEATQVPHYYILEKIKPTLLKQGVKLDIITVNDYVKPNLDVNDGEADANFFQHLPYLNEFQAERKTNLVSVAKVHVEPMAVYSKTVKKLANLKKGAVVAIPNDVTNAGRALLLLQKYGLIKLKDPNNIKSSEKDIVKNPKNITFKALDAALIPRVLGEVDAAVINTNYALQAKLNPLKDSIAIESSDSPYANILVVKKGNEKKDAIKKLIKALQSEEVKKFILDKYKGAVIPAF